MGSLFFFPLLALELFLLAHTASSQSPSTYFTHPPDSGTGSLYGTNDVLTLGSNVNVTWVTNATSYGIWLWQQNTATSIASVNSTSIYFKSSNQAEVGYVIWPVSAESFDLTLSPVFFFNIGPFASLTENLATCHYFNISDSTVQPTTSSSTVISVFSTSSASSTSSTSNPSSTSSIASVASTNAQTTTSSSPTGGTTASGNNTSGSSTTHIGLGVGLGIGIPLVLIFAGFLALRIRNIFKPAGKKGSNSNPRLSLFPKYPVDNSNDRDAHLPGYNYAARYNAPRPYELPGQDRSASYGPVEIGDHR